MFENEKDEITSLKKLQETLLIPKGIEKKVNSDLFYDRFEISLNKLQNINQSIFISIFNKFKR